MPHKVYTTVFNQFSNSIPEAIVLENTFATPPRWVKNAVGLYTLVFGKGEAPLIKRFVITSCNDTATEFKEYGGTVDDKVSFASFKLVGGYNSIRPMIQDNLLDVNRAYVEVRVYD